jgi:hypothetical protein
VNQILLVDVLFLHNHPMSLKWLVDSLRSSVGTFSVLLQMSSTAGVVTRMANTVMSYSGCKEGSLYVEAEETFLLVFTCVGFFSLRSLLT